MFIVVAGVADVADNVDRRYGRVVVGVPAADAESASNPIDAISVAIDGNLGFLVGGSGKMSLSVGKSTL